MFFSDEPLRHDFDLFAECGRGKTLAPDLFVQRIDHVGAAVLGRQRAVGIKAARQRRGVQPFPGDLLQRLLERAEVVGIDGAAGCHRVAAKTQQHAGATLGHQIKRVAQMKAGNRSARTFQFMLFAGCLAGGENESRAVQPVFDARGHDADHAFVKVGTKNCNRRRRRFIAADHRVGGELRLLAHARLDAAAFAVDGVE